MLSRSVRTPSREGQLTPAPKAPAVRIYGGAIVCANAAGVAVPGAADAALRFLGVAESEAISGERTVHVRRNVDFLLRSAAGADAVTAAGLGRPCWIVDDEFVAGSDGGGTRPAAGIVTGLEPGGRVWVRGEPAQSGSSGGKPAAAMRRIYAGSSTTNDPDSAPIPSASGTITLPMRPTFMQVRTGWDLYNGSTRSASGTSEGLYIEGDTHVSTIFGSVNWHEFGNIGGTADTVSLALLAQDYRLGELFTLEYAPATGVLSLLAGEDPPSSWRPVIRSLLIAGQ